MVLPRLTLALLAFEVADEQLEEGGLARAVAANNDGARTERERRLDVLQDEPLSFGVLEADVLECHHRLAEGANALGLARVGEVHRQDEPRRDHLVHLCEGGGQAAGRRLGLGVRGDRRRGRGRAVDRRVNFRGLGWGGTGGKRCVVHARQTGGDLGLEALELGEGHRVVDELARLAQLAAIVVVGDVGADGVDEVIVVRDDGDGDALEVEQVVGEPVDGLAIEVVGGLIEQQQLRLVHHRDGD
mmetsp:Transcript_21308/g.68819  ORF Transcript_21308/g.68819 Transcript_21308/m.68819 type:complete len:244 (-) Transcript_21308:1370-2101(-)